MAKDILEKLTDEWYSDSEELPETEDDVLEDELLEMHVLMKTRGTIFSGDDSVTVKDIDKEDSEK